MALKDASNMRASKIEPVLKPFGTGRPERHPKRSPTPPAKRKREYSNCQFSHHCWNCKKAISPQCFKGTRPHYTWCPNHEDEEKKDHPVQPKVPCAACTRKEEAAAKLEAQEISQRFEAERLAMLSAAEVASGGDEVVKGVARRLRTWSVKGGKGRRDS